MRGRLNFWERLVSARPNKSLQPITSSGIVRYKTGTARNGITRRRLATGGAKTPDYEIVVSGPQLDDVRKGMKVGIEAATSMDGVLEIRTANYDGKLGSGKIYLHSLFD